MICNLNEVCIDNKWNVCRKRKLELSFDRTSLWNIYRVPNTMKNVFWILLVCFTLENVSMNKGCHNFKPQSIHMHYGKINSKKYFIHWLCTHTVSTSVHGSIKWRVVLPGRKWGKASLILLKQYQLLPTLLVYPYTILSIYFLH